MRGICLFLALLSVPAVVAGQHQRPAQAGGVGGAVTASAPLPSIGLPLPSIGLPLPSIGLSPRATSDDEWRRQRGGNQRGDGQHGGERRDGEWRDGGQWRGGSFNSVQTQRATGPGYIYVGPTYPYFGPQYPFIVGPQYPYAGMTRTEVVVGGSAVPGTITVVPEPLDGTLRLEVEPAEILQVFVDGQYVGTPNDLRGELQLAPGSRRIEFRAPGHKTLTIDAQIVSQRAIVYRATLEPTAPVRVVPSPAPAPASARVAPAEPSTPAPPPAPPRNRTMYLIPGCYMGNVPPQDLKLPAGCDLSKLTTVTPER